MSHASAACSSSCIHQCHVSICAVERRKEQLGDTKAVTGKKKLDKQEEQLRVHSRDLNMVKMKSVLVIGFTFTALLGMFNTM